MKKVNMMVTGVISLFFASMAVAGTAEVTWTNPDDYRDVYAGENGHRVKFKQRVFSDLEGHFAKLAEKLPEGQTLKVDVKDLDLAGDVNQSIRRIRVVKELFFPRIEFSYQVVDASGQVVTSGDENLKDMNFMSGSKVRYSSDSLGYEKRMLDDWFKKTLIK